ncbi:MAG TPA: 23S rRNA (uracil(1939)-C(5))-methyltransferase RlmD [Lachnospiraceae bacterium]|nr:23S rRNA (uracil(1939)-C(5))-methyltransferase RlmD [Lachnospiraceae bacterium]
MEYKKNDILTVTIEDIGNDGEGIGKVNGYILFVKDAVIGDTVKCKIMKAKKSYAYAKLEKIIVPSDIRVEPECRFHRQCGGCQIQAMNYKAQLAYKQKKVKDSLIRIGGFEAELVESVMEPAVGMGKAYHYRNKAQFPVGTDKEGNLVAGFYAGRTHHIVANTDCALGAEENKEILESVLEYMKKFHVSAYDEKTGTGLVRHILIRKGFASGEIMVCLVINYKGRDVERAAKEGKILPCQKKLTDVLRKIKGMTSVSLNINTDRTNVIMGDTIYTIWGKDKISDTIRVRDGKNFSLTGEEIVFHLSPLSFYQVNPVQTEKLYSLAVEYAGLTGEETVWDLYCGIGTISLFFAKKAKKVYGVEVIPQAIEDAKENAVYNGIGNVEFLAGKAEEILPEKYEKEGIRADVIVVDPPRKGCDKECLETMLLMQPEKIVYVSCEPATLARDLRVLCDGGYELKRVRAVDQFGGTVHVETVVQLSQRKPDDVIEVDLDISELDLTASEAKATYEEIKQYVLEQSGLLVSNLYIAQVKHKCGLDMRLNYNMPKSENAKQPKCPADKEAAIMDALRHFKMI